MNAKRLLLSSIIASGVVCAAAERASARIWVGGSGVYGGYSCWGSGETQRGSYNDSASSDTGSGSSAHIAASDPNNGIERGVAGNDEASRAAVAMDLARRDVEKKFKSTPEWIEASLAFDDAKAANDRAKARVLAKLMNDAAYRAARSANAAAQKALDAVRAAGASIGSPELLRAAAEAMHARTAIAQLEAVACSNDSAASTSAAKLKAASDVMSQMRRQERAAVFADADWQAAQQTYMRAVGTVASARSTPSERLR